MDVERKDIKMAEIDAESLGNGDCVPDGNDSNVNDDDIDETAEVLMTDMRLDDESDIKSTQPDFEWQYCIEIYPWNVNDLTDNFVRLMKLSQFSLITMKKGATTETESAEDKLLSRQRQGHLKMYLENSHSAKGVMRNFTWKKMTSTQLTVEITKRGSATVQMETAVMEVDTFNLCKIRFREKAKGELNERSAKASNLPGSMSGEFLEVVFTRVFPVLGKKEGTRNIENPQMKLQDIFGFDGSMDFDCLLRGSCRSFVLAHKKIHIQGKEVSIKANDAATMVAPPHTHDIGAQRRALEKRVAPAAPRSTTGQFKQVGRGASTFPRRELMSVGSAVAGRGGPGVYPGPAAWGFNRDVNSRGNRPRGLGRGASDPIIRPASAYFPRPSSLMTLPMTGRQKMNEKLRRGNPVMHSAQPGGLLYPPDHRMPHRPSASGSGGDSFNNDISSLQHQLEQNTKDIKAKIERLQNGGGFYERDMHGYDTREWRSENHNYEQDYGREGHWPESYNDNSYSQQNNTPMQSYDHPEFERPFHLPMSRQGSASSATVHQNFQPGQVQRGVSQPGRGAPLRGMRKGASTARVKGAFW